MLAIVAVPVCAQIAAPPAARDYVVDQPAVLTRDEFSRINTALKSIEDRTTAQIVVLIVNTTGGEAIEDYAQRVVESDPRWRLGQKGKDNGCLILIAIRDRRFRIHPGYGLEGALPDVLCKRIADQHFRPNFKRGAYAAGIWGAVDAIGAVLAKEAGAPTAQTAARSNTARKSKSRGTKSTGWFGLLLLFLLLSIAISAASGRGRGRRRQRYSTGAADVAWGWMLANAMRGRNNSGGWGSGGGWSGGGSFGGGGGGSFGGGGASGGW
ncbi:MAG: TPM domain-containing protein [Phycisphaerales bacterium]|nr:TPM domain-containing protein [Phycisphaerales bacterium]